MSDGTHDLLSLELRIAQTYPQFALQLMSTGWSSQQLALIRAAFDTGRFLFASRERPTGKSFADHLVGTASVTLIGGGDANSVAAALVHAAYDQGIFPNRTGGPTTQHRAWLTEQLGPQVEDLVYRYHTLGRSATTARLLAAQSGQWTKEERAVVLIRVANEVDDASFGGLTLCRKHESATHQREVLEIVASLAPLVGTPLLTDLTRHVLLRDMPSFPIELVLSESVSRRLLPPDVISHPATWPRKVIKWGRKHGGRGLRAVKILRAVRGDKTT
jgi:(p)ppGpp synthase/HD superfamily hydrolase